MNFDIFKRVIKSIMIFEETFDEEIFHDWYIFYKESNYKGVKKWAKFWFEDVNFNTHNYSLKSNT